MTSRPLLLATTSLVFLAAPAFAQNATPAPLPPSSIEAAQQAPAAKAPTAQTVPPAVEDPGDEADQSQEIVVTGQRARGSVVGDIPPENTLTSRDIRATGATSISELLTALAPQLGSARGRGGEAPVILLNGQRISGFQEIRDLPPEAIERAEILPEEVALKYGYAADQRVLNIVLRPRFRSTAVRADAGTATDGGYSNGVADVSRLMINNKGRNSLTVHAEGNSALRENERNLLLQPLPTLPDPTDPRRDRTLIGSQRLLRATGTANRTVFRDVSATLNGELSHSEGRSLFGVPTATLDVPPNSPFTVPAGSDVLRAFDQFGPLTRRTSSDSGHLGLSLNGTKQRWHYSVTGNADIVRSVTRSDRGPDVSALQSRINAGDTTLDPLGTLPLVDLFPGDRSRSTRKSVGLDGTLNGPIATLPAGRANVTLKVGADTLHLDSFASRAGISRSGSLGRDHGTASVNLDVPIAERGGALGAIGSLTLNANAEVERFSDFGTLTTLGAGANWTPAPRLTFITSYTREEGAPSINNLGDPVLTTPGTRVFDFTQGRTVLVTATTGGNPALLADSRNVFKLGAHWQPFEKTDLRLRADFVSARLKNPVQTFPGPTLELEAAFPDRFTRDSFGTLTAVDFRPVNYDSARSDVVRIGFDFTKPLKSARPPQSLIDEFRRQRAQAGAQAGPTGGPAGGDRVGGGGGRPGGGGGRFGGNQRGRLEFSLTDTISLVDRAIIRPGLPALDFLRGDAAGGGFGGGRARHAVEAQAGYFNNGLGARLSANYRSATRVTGGANGDLAFSPLATFDLRLFANLGDNLSLLAKHPWLRGASVRLEATNIFNQRQNVRDQFGAVPLGYQQDLIDPLGRTISISIRKLFIPSRFFQRHRGPRAS